MQNGSTNMLLAVAVMHSYYHSMSVYYNYDSTFNIILSRLLPMLQRGSSHQVYHNVLLITLARRPTSSHACASKFIVLYYLVLPIY
jgi:hypothetical protein